MLGIKLCLLGCQKKMETVVSKSLEENVQPFKEKMELFLTLGKKEYFLILETRFF